MANKNAVIAGLAAALAGLVALMYWPDNTAHQHTGTAAKPLAVVTIPASFSPAATTGKKLFEDKCASCHGKNASGKDGLAPPLVHKIYEPSHHADESFQRAVALGVRAHHWRFGDMPRIDGVSRADMVNVIAYIRELQRANGIN